MCHVEDSRISQVVSGNNRICTIRVTVVQLLIPLSLTSLVFIHDALGAFETLRKGFGKGEAELLLVYCGTWEDLLYFSRSPQAPLLVSCNPAPTVMKRRLPGTSDCYPVSRR